MERPLRRDAARWLRLGLAVSAFAAASGAPFASTFDPASELRVFDDASARQVRERLVAYIWKTAGPPRAMVTVVEAEQPPLFSPSSRNVARLATLENAMERGVSTRSQLVQARRFADCLLVYHFGHDEGPVASGAEELLERALDGGCDLLVLAMPLTRGNPKPVVDTEFGPIRLSHHGAFALLDSADFSPIRYFVEPVALGITYAEAQRGAYRLVAMAGLSGGAWTTTLYAALDPRVQASYQIAGTLPLSLRGDAVGDWEQIVPDLYRTASYLDLYALATHPARRHVQLLNVNDPCCFSGRGAEAYAEPVARVAAALGGSFVLDLEDGPARHGIAARHAELILADITRLGGPTFPPPASPCAGSRAVTLVPPFTRDGGLSFTAPMDPQESDTLEQPTRSRAVLCEDGKPLGPAHSSHAEIRARGGGRYSHWGAQMFFSTSDASDPNANGRRYEALTR